MEGYSNAEKTAIPDLSYLRKVTGGDEVSMKEVITIFIEDAPELMNSLRNSALARDHQQLKSVTHKLIPQLTYVGILSVITDVKIINSESGEMDDLMERVDRIIKIIGNSIEQLKTLV